MTSIVAQKCTELSVDEWIEVLNNPKMTLPKDLDLLKALYEFPQHQAAASELGVKLDASKKNASRVAQAAPMNTRVYHYAKRIQKFTDITDFCFSIRQESKNKGKEKFWDFFFEGWEEGDLFIWRLKPNLVQGLEQALLVDCADKVQDEILLAEEVPSDVFCEGAKTQITVNRYERDRKARQACIAYWQAKCAVCDFVFVDKYGKLGEGFIHVHHIVPLSSVAGLEKYEVKPKEDLRPVCPNCHAMLHKRKPPYSIDELKAIIAQVQAEQKG